MVPKQFYKINGTMASCRRPTRSFESMDQRSEQSDTIGNARYRYPLNLLRTILNARVI